MWTTAGDHGSTPTTKYTQELKEYAVAQPPPDGVSSRVSTQHKLNLSTNYTNKNRTTTNYPGNSNETTGQSSSMKTLAKSLATHGGEPQATRSKSPNLKAQAAWTQFFVPSTISVRMMYTGYPRVQMGPTMRIAGETRTMEKRRESTQ